MRTRQSPQSISVAYFANDSEVEPLIIDMRENLGTLHQVLNESVHDLVLRN